MKYEKQYTEFKVNGRISYFLDYRTGAGKIVNKEKNTDMIAEYMDYPITQEKIWLYVDKLREKFDPILSKI